MIHISTETFTLTFTFTFTFMGIKDFLTFVRQRMPKDLVRPVRVRRGCFAASTTASSTTASAASTTATLTRVAVDVTIFVHKLVHSRGTTSPSVIADEFAGFAAQLEAMGARPIWVFDGVHKHAKHRELARRREELVKARKHYDDLQLQWALAEAESVLRRRSHADTADAAADEDAIATETATSRKRPRDEPESAPVVAADHEVTSSVTEPSTTTTTTTTTTMTLPIMPPSVEDLERARNRILRPTTETFRVIRDVIERRFPSHEVITAPDEAEAMAACLVRHGRADVLLTEDSDALIFGAERVVFRWPTSQAYELRRSDVVRALELDDAGLTVFATLLGNDFCDRLVQMGPVTALAVAQGARDGVTAADRVRNLVRVLAAGLEAGLEEHERTSVLTSASTSTSTLPEWARHWVLACSKTKDRVASARAALSVFASDGVAAAAHFERDLLSV